MRVLKRGADGHVEVAAREHGRGGIRQIEELTTPLGHFLEEATK